MPALITHAIAQQGFEIVRDRIGAILLVELTNQKTIQAGDFPEDINIYSEKLTPYDSSEQISIDVRLAGATYDGHTQKDAEGRAIYHIDLDSSAVQTAETSGSQVSMKRLHKFIGMINYIFRAPFYRLMDLPPGLVGGTYVEQFQTLDPNRKEDTDFTGFARIILAVRIYEDTEMWAGVPFNLNNTTVKLDLTEKGYKFVFNN